MKTAAALKGITSGQLFRETLRERDIMDAFQTLVAGKNRDYARKPGTDFPKIVYEVETHDNGFHSVWHLAIGPQGVYHATLLGLFIPSHGDYAKWLAAKLTNNALAGDLQRLLRENRQLGNLTERKK